MSELTDRLREAGERAKGTDHGALLQWAVLHIESQDQALADVRKELDQETAERQTLQTALHDAKTSMQGTLAILQQAWCPPVELARDFAPHINLMAGHGDPDYLKKNGLSIRHIDCRTTSTKDKT